MCPLQIWTTTLVMLGTLFASDAGFVSTACALKLLTVISSRLRFDGIQLTHLLGMLWQNVVQAHRFGVQTPADVCISSHLLIPSPVLNVCSNSSASVSLLCHTGLTGAFDNVTAEQAAGFLYMHLADTSVQYACASPGDMRSRFSSA